MVLVELIESVFTGPVELLVTAIAVTVSAFAGPLGVHALPAAGVLGVGGVWLTNWYLGGGE